MNDLRWIVVVLLVPLFAMAEERIREMRVRAEEGQ